MTFEDIEVFADGNMTPVIRRGDEVERALPDGWKASHAVLRHLEAKGFPYSPRLIRHDDSHEWLTFMPGQSIPADLAGYRDLSLVVQVGGLIRQYHDAMSDFVPPDDVVWGPTIGLLEPIEVICHRDIAPWNVIVNNKGDLTGLIDWDLVQPGPRIWDLAYAAWRFGLLEENGDYGSTADRARRITTLLDAYGLTRDARAGFIDMIRERQQNDFDSVEVLGRQGHPGYATLLEKGAHHWGKPATDWVNANRDELIALVES